MIKNYVLYLTLVFLICTCTSKHKFHKQNISLLDEIIGEHDAIMEKMPTITSLKTSISKMNNSDSLFVDTLDKLEQSYTAMMNFMKNFSEEFPYNSYPMNRKLDNEDEEYLKNINNRLEIQKKEILQVDKLFDSSIEIAEKLVQK